MARSPLKAKTESDIKTLPGGTLEFDENTLRAIAEVNLQEGNKEFQKKEFSKAIHFYTEGIEVNCKDNVKNAELYSNIATAHFKMALVYKNEGNDEYRRKEFSNAVCFYTEGIKANCKDNELNARLYSNRATAYFYSGNYSGSLDDAKAATELLPTYVKAIARGASACVKLNLYEEAIAWCDKGLAINKNNKTLLDLRASSVALLNKLQETDLTKVNLSEHQSQSVKDQKSSKELRDRIAITYLELQLKTAKETGDRVGEGRACHELGVFYHLEDLEKAIYYYKLHLKIAKEVGDKIAGRTYCFLGNDYCSLGDFKKAIDYHELCLKIAKDEGDRVGEGSTYGNLGNAYYGLGDFKKAIDYYKLHLDIAKNTGDRTGKGIAYGNLGTAYTSLGNFKKAIYYHDLQLKIAREMGHRAIEGKAFSGLGNAYLSLGDLKQALVYFNLRLSIAKEMGDRVGEGKACGSIGNTYQGFGDFMKALDYHELHLQFSKEVRDKAGESVGYGNLGNVYQSLGDFDKAIEYHKLHLKTAKELGNKDGEGRAYGNLGNAYHSRGDFKKAISYHEHGLKITKEVGNRAEEGSEYGNLGCSYCSLGDFKNAMHYHKLHLEIAKEVGDRAGEGNAYLNIGNDYVRSGDLKKAIYYYERRLEITKEMDDRVGEGQANGNLGFVYVTLRDYVKAIPCYELNLKISKEVGDKAGEGHMYGNLGRMYNSLGDFQNALYYYGLRLKIATEVGERFHEGRAHGNLGNVYGNLGNYQKAIDCYQLQLRIAKEVGDRAGEGSVYVHLGSGYHRLGDLRKALYCHELHLKIAREVGDKVQEGHAHGNLGTVHGQLGNYKKAIDCHEASLRIAKEVEDRVGEALTYNSLGCIFESQGSLKKALEYYQSSVELLNNVTVERLFKDEWKISLRDMYESMYINLWKLLLRQDKVVEALLAAEQGRAQALKYLMELKYGLRSSHQQSSPLEETLHDILNCLPSNAVFIAVDQKEIFFWVIRSGKDVKLRRKETPEPCDDLATFFKSLVGVAYDEIGVGIDVKCEDRSLDNPKDERIVNWRLDQTRGSYSSQRQTNALRTLYDAIISPIADLVSDDELIIVPDGPLCLAPFAAFVDCHSKYLSESFRIRVIPSLTSLKLIADCPADYHLKSGALLVGDPWVQEVTKDGTILLEQLPGAREEVERIGKVVKTVPLTGTEATKDEVLKRLPTVALVHIAAHGRMETGEIALCPNPSRSSQVPENEDYLLTMRDVLNVKLRAQLVVLSCCHSGRGEIKAEGVVGIARAFLGAGARSVLVSLWAIDDDATLEFMKAFYRELVRGRSASEALNQAMKCLRESDEFSEVKYWAPFVLIGDDVTLEFDGSD